MNPFGARRVGASAEFYDCVPSTAAAGHRFWTAEALERAAPCWSWVAARDGC